MHNETEQLYGRRSQQMFISAEDGRDAHHAMHEVLNEWNQSSYGHSRRNVLTDFQNLALKEKAKVLVAGVTTFDSVMEIQGQQVTYGVQDGTRRVVSSF